ncbi:MULTISPECIES: hypothetical protein [unclassified Sphingomonas]|uniref:hypothetical protein n=1 Tax=unclassified Sphingomonas TaxID=196159 RepID=UPI0006F4ACB8|nr:MULTISPECIES: hypothetical protein [unclassified Sphingomonas]KQX18223.1 hypothetical protein ASD17_20065 [Sphingomonas sp. Root1294]KQY71029.1 hypothetical protein ASD39_23965 [Sphingomonas sp. Root50]KRB91589.1 hypothetical protein ASE22_06345 [Sphingomonas sp. Root720]
MNMMTTNWLEQAESLPFDALVEMAVRISEKPRPMPPSWMIAPSFRGMEQAAGMAGVLDRPEIPAPSAMQPYRSIREVPRSS